MSASVKASQRIGRKATRRDAEYDRRFHRQETVNAVLRRVQDVVCDHAPPSEFNTGTDNNTFTLSEFQSVIVDDEHRNVLEQVIALAEQCGVIRAEGQWTGTPKRSTGQGVWRVIDGDRLYGPEFDADFKRIAPRI